MNVIFMGRRWLSYLVLPGTSRVAEHQLEALKLSGDILGHETSIGKALIADDDEDFRRLLVHRAKKMGLSVDEASDGTEARPSGNNPSTYLWWIFTCRVLLDWMSSVRLNARIPTWKRSS